MNKYELTAVLSPDLSTEDHKKLVSEIEKLVSGLKGKVLKSEDWGEKQLAYQMNKLTRASFYYWEISVEAKAAGEISKRLKLMTGIMRILLVGASE